MPNPETNETTAKTELPATPVTPAELTKPLIAGMPEVTESITDAASFERAPDVSTAPQSETVVETRTPVTPVVNDDPNKDNNGISFDPNYHTVDEFGNPKKNSHGNFYKKRGVESLPQYTRRAPPSFVGTNRNNGMNGSAVVSEITPEQRKMRSERLAKMIVPTVDRFMQGLLTEGAKLEDTEKSELIEASAVYMESRGLDDLPPGFVLAMLFSGIYAEKLSKPTVKERLILYWLKIKTFFTGKGK